MLDFNRTITKTKAANVPVNEWVDMALDVRIASEPKRTYLGASIIGSECLRQIQLDWQEPVAPEPRLARIFARGHWVEKYTADLLHEAGFRIVRGQGVGIEFSQIGGYFRGHADGKIIAGPVTEGMGFPCIWECKGLGSRGWTQLEKYGLAKAYPHYADQVALYQAYLDLTDHPALFTACNMDTMEMLFLLVPFDAARAQAASDRAVTVVQATTAGEALPRIGADADDWRCRLCAHHQRCWG